MTDTESDEQFVERIGLDFDLSNTADIQRLFALARRGAEMQWRPIEEDYEGEVLLWPRNSELPSHFLPLPPPPSGEQSDDR